MTLTLPANYAFEPTWNQQLPQTSRVLKLNATAIQVWKNKYYNTYLKWHVLMENGWLNLHRKHQLILNLRVGWTTKTSSAWKRDRSKGPFTFYRRGVWNFNCYILWSPFFYHAFPTTLTESIQTLKDCRFKNSTKVAIIQGNSNVLLLAIILITTGLQDR